MSFAHAPKAPSRARHVVLPHRAPKLSAGSTQTATATGSKQTAQAAAPQIGVSGTSEGFNGDSYAQQTSLLGPDQDIVPPDNGTAVNGQFVVEFVNSSAWIYLRNAGGAGPVAGADLNGFFIPSNLLTCNVSSDPCYEFTDPRVVWDPQSGRWFASGAGVSLTNNRSNEYVAVSSSSDPLGDWTVYSIWANSSGLSSDPCYADGCTGDQPRLGVTSDKVALFWDDYDASSGNFLEEEARVIAKSTLVSGAGLTINTIEDFRNTTDWFAVVPASDSTSSDVWAVYNETEYGDGKVHALRLRGSVPSISISNQAFATNQTVGIAGLVAYQPNLTDIDANDSRVTNVVFNGFTLAATANDACSGYLCVRVFLVNVAGGSAPSISSRDINQSNEYLFDGAAAFDGNGKLDVVMNRDDQSSTYPSVAVTAIDPLQSGFSTPTVIHAGLTNYYDAAERCTGVPCRWGDYSSAVPDPCDSAFAWTSAEYATAASSDPNWGSWISPLSASGGTIPATCAGAPTLTGVSPASGPAGCGVTITGSNFLDTKYVFFGNSTATSFRVLDSTHLFAVPPASGTGSVTVSVVNAEGDSPNTPADMFAYTTPATVLPCVNGISPDTAPADGSTQETVAITGANFTYPATVQFGGVGSVNVSSGSPTSMTLVAPATSTGQVVDVTVTDAASNTSSIDDADKFTYTDGGYTMNGYGGVYGFGGAQAPPAPIDAPSWPGWLIARQMTLRKDRGSGYVLDGFGGIHPFGGAPVTTGGPYFGWDIARDIVLNPCDSTQTSGYVLDGYGGIHPFGGAPAITDGPYWLNWDIAREIVLNSCGHGGYVLDGWGGLHPFGGASTISDSPYWPGWNVAAGVVLTGDGMGYEADMFGGVHAFGGATQATNFAYYSGWYVISGITWVPGVGGYTLDQFGGVHPFNNAPTVTYGGYSGGSYIFRDID